MAKILITAYGTAGDVLPYTALGQALQIRSHQVCMAIPTQSHALASGLLVTSTGHEDITPETVQKSALLWDQWSISPEELATRKELPGSNNWFDPVKGIDYLLEAAQGADLIVCNPQQELFAAVVAEMLDISLVRAVVTPLLLYQPNNWWRISQWLRQSGNTTYDPYHVLRLQSGLRDLNAWKQYWQYDRLLFATSPHLYPSPPYCLPGNQTGFWFYDSPQWNDWQPDQKLSQFMTADMKPIVLTFSSQPVRQAREFIEVHVRAALKLGRRILIQGGWSGLNESLLPNDIDRHQVMFAGFLPQDWLFAQAAAVITHGGIGTIARALRQGCPLLLEPHTYEQCFNAQRVLSWEVGVAMHPKQLTVEGLARVLEKKVLSDKYRHKACEISNYIQTEQGLHSACQSIESWLPHESCAALLK